MPIVTVPVVGTGSLSPASLGDMKTRIAAEIHRTDLTTNIGQAISSAITKYQSRRFEAAEEQSSFNTVASQQSYTSGDTGFPTTIGQIDSVQVTVNGTNLLLEPMSYTDLQRVSAQSNATGQPSRWAWYARSLFFYPTPDKAYAIVLSHQMRSTPPASDGDDDTIWTNELEPLIRHCAKKFLFRDVMNDIPKANAAEAAEAEWLNVFETESVQLQDDGSGLAPNW
jgi:hypothetical protein